MVKNVHTSLELVNKVQENLSPGNIRDKVISFIPECVNKISSSMSMNKVAIVLGVQNPEPGTSTGMQTSRKS